MSQRETNLIYAARPRVLLKFAGELLFVAGLASLGRVVIALLLRDWQIGLVSGACSASLIVIGGTLARLRASQEVQQNELLVITSVVFLIVCCVSAVPFAADGITFIDALFESVSGITTTGLSTLQSVEDRGFVFLFSRAWLQWIGGLGFVVVSVALIVPSKVAARTVLQSFDDQSSVMTGARQHARIVTIAYTSLTAVIIAVLLIAGLGWQDAILYALAGISTGGFAPRNDSLASLTSVQQFAVQLTSALGALPLAAWYYAVTSKSYGKLFDGQFGMFVGITALVTAGLTWTLWESGAKAPAQTATILALSSQSTTGYAPIALADLPEGGKALLTGSMLVGGEFGSTAGGLKIIRILLLFKAVRILIRRIAAPPDAVLDPYYQGRAIPPQTIVGSAVVGGLFIAAAFVLWLPFVFAGHDPLNALFEVTSAIGTVGLSAGVTSESLSTPLKLALCAGMLLGRLEIIAWLVLLSPRTWAGPRKEAV